MQPEWLLAACKPDAVWPEGGMTRVETVEIVAARALAHPARPGHWYVAAWGDAAPDTVVLGPGGRARALVAGVGGEVLDLCYAVSPFLKLVVYVPSTHLEPVRQALWDAGAGYVGRYRCCSFAAEGTGTFLPVAGAQPFIGEVGRLESVAEARLEVLVPRWCRPRVEAALLAAHPYEEVAYDWLPLENRVRYPRMVRDAAGELWTDTLDLAAAVRALGSSTPRLHAERVDFDVMHELERYGVPVEVHAPGSFLVSGLRRLLEAAQAKPELGPQLEP